LTNDLILLNKAKLLTTHTIDLLLNKLSLIEIGSRWLTLRKKQDMRADKFAYNGGGLT